MREAPRRDVRHYILTVGRDLEDQPVRELRPVKGGAPILLALGRVERLRSDDLADIIRDLLAEQDRRHYSWD